ncbi:MAG: hypothetical protein PHS93_09550 [Candidatus Omnitrophica bacterium]|nr:hypothetical protein [Candidatus Omnitrophota bacterium]MDD5353392.1 hypothetical protein [Candidatus Omnitrophota bacterium]
MENKNQVLLSEPPPPGWKIIKVYLGLDGKAYTMIEKIEEKDFKWYWKKFRSEEKYDFIPGWNMCKWFVLIDFYRWFAKELNGDWVPNWKYVVEDKYHIYKNYETNEYYYCFSNVADSHFGIIFSKEAVQKALKILPREFLDKLFQV